MLCSNGSLDPARKLWGLGTPSCGQYRLLKRLFIHESGRLSVTSCLLVGSLSSDAFFQLVLSFELLSSCGSYVMFVGRREASRTVCCCEKALSHHPQVASEFWGTRPVQIILDSEPARISQPRINGQQERQKRMQTNIFEGIKPEYLQPKHPQNPKPLDIL